MAFVFATNISLVVLGGFDEAMMVGLHLSPNAAYTFDGSIKMPFICISFGLL